MIATVSCDLLNFPLLYSTTDKTHSAINSNRERIILCANIPGNSLGRVFMVKSKSIPLKYISRINLIRNIIKASIIAVGNDSI